MGIRERFEWSAIISENQTLRVAARSAIAHVAKQVYEARSCIETPQVLGPSGSSLVLAELEDPELPAFWQRHLAQPGTAGSMLVTVGVPDATRIARLALLGPVFHVPAPIDPERLEAHLARLFGRQITLLSLAQSIVGQGSITRATCILREGMFLEAMRRTLGNRMAAAELLQIDRRAVQRMAKLLDLPARLPALTESRSAS
jgi:hypothetical protein